MSSKTTLNHFRPSAHLALAASLFLMLTTTADAASSAFAFSAVSIDGKPAPLSEYKGKVLLIVNVASQCGYTPQYAALQDLYVKYKDKGLEVLAFPANNFGQQEPGTNAEIAQFCSRTYHVTFPVFGKISVLGDDKLPLFDFLTSKDTNPKTAGEVRWNFTKFLVGRDGKVIARFEPDISPDWPEIVTAVEKALKPAEPSKDKSETKI